MYLREKVCSFIEYLIRNPNIPSNKSRIIELKNSIKEKNVNFLKEKALADILPMRPTYHEKKEIESIFIVVPYMIKILEKQGLPPINEDEETVEEKARGVYFPIAFKEATKGKNPHISKEAGERRFLQLLKTNRSNIAPKLYPLLNMLFSGQPNLKINWEQLIKDLTFWDDNRALEINPRNNWAKTYFRAFEFDKNEEK